MKRMEIGGGENIYSVARKAVDKATMTDDVVFVFNGVETRATIRMTASDVVKAHFDEVERRQAARRAADPAYKIAQEILSGQPEDVKNALRSILNDG